MAREGRGQICSLGPEQPSPRERGAKAAGACLTLANLCSGLTAKCPSVCTTGRAVRALPIPGRVFLSTLLPEPRVTNLGGEDVEGKEHGIGVHRLVTGAVPAPLKPQLADVLCCHGPKGSCDSQSQDQPPSLELGEELCSSPCCSYW